MVERLVRNEKVSGSNPLCSTTGFWRCAEASSSDQTEAFAEEPLEGEQEDDGGEPPPGGPKKGFADGGLFAVSALEEGWEVGGLAFAKELAAGGLGKGLKEGRVEGELGEFLVFAVTGSEGETKVTAGGGGAFGDGDFEVALLEARGEAAVNAGVVGVGGEGDGAEGFAIAEQVGLGRGVWKDRAVGVAQADADFSLVANAVAEAVAADAEAWGLDLEGWSGDPGGDLHPESLVVEVGDLEAPAPEFVAGEVEDGAGTGWAKDDGWEGCAAG